MGVIHLIYIYCIYRIELNNDFSCVIKVCHITGDIYREKSVLVCSCAGPESPGTPLGHVMRFRTSYILV